MEYFSRDLFIISQAPIIDRETLTAALIGWTKQLDGLSVAECEKRGYKIDSDWCIYLDNEVKNENKRNKCKIKG